MAAIIHLLSGVRASLPNGVTLLEKDPAESRRTPSHPVPGVIPMPRPAASEVDKIAAALEKQELELVDTVQLGLSAEALRRSTPNELPEVAIEVNLKADENAVILLEQDGLYSWHFNPTELRAYSEPSKGRRRAPKEISRTVAFSLPLEGIAAAPSRMRTWPSDLVAGRAKAFVFRFAGRSLLSRGASFLERHVQTGFVVINGNDPSRWSKIADFSELELPQDRRARILLFVHGTFSSTQGGFAALAATPWGRSLLDGFRANYDAVVGFDHPTLSVDPLFNATALLRGLEARHWVQSATIDAVSHSRGGITLRSLIERLLPATSLPLRVKNAVFVGAVNGGTELAEPNNWRVFINTYTNLAAGLCRAIAMFPQTAFVANLTGELFKSIGMLVKILAEEAVTEKMLPGLAAMQPTGHFITDLNQIRQPDWGATDVQYYAVTSDFQPEFRLDSIKELPSRLLRDMAENTVKRFMGMANDLVVNTDSMIHIPTELGSAIKDTLAFGTNGIVYHTNYFLQPQVTNALARWFELEEPKLASPARQRGLTQRGALLPMDVPACADTNVILAMAEDPGRETLERINQLLPSYVVIERYGQAKRCLYAFKTEELISLVSNNLQATLHEILDLNDVLPSQQLRRENVPEISPAGEAQHFQTERVVVLDHDRVVGVTESHITPIPTSELVQCAIQLSSAKKESVGIGARRTMPRFSSRTSLSEGFEARPAVVTGPVARTMRGAAHVKTSAIKTFPNSRSEKAVCHFLVEMDDTVVFGDATSLDVTVSREAIAKARPVSASASPTAVKDGKLTIEVIPKKNFLPIGTTRFEVDLPDLEKPSVRVFDIQPTDVGEGELLIRFRQGMLPLANLTLRCQIVAQRTRPSELRRQEASIVEGYTERDPLHQLTIMEIERHGSQLYQFILESPSLGLKDIYESRPIPGNRKDYISGIYEDIEKRHLGNKNDLQQFQKELRELGAGLWDELFPEKLQHVLWEQRHKIASMLVFSEEPFIPWELVHLKEPGKGLPVETFFFAQMGILRWLHNVGWPPTKLQAQEGRCRYIIPHYPHPGFRLSAAEDEARFLEELFKATPVAPHLAPVRNLLETPGSFDFLHFAGHGVADPDDIARSELLLEGRIDGENYVTEKFRPSVVEHGPRLVGTNGVRPIVTLNACQTGRAGYKMTSIGGFSRAFLKAGAGMVCAAQWSVGDEPARQFTEHLYLNLKDGNTLAEASTKARNQTSAEDATRLAYTVYGNPYAKLER